VTITGTSGGLQHSADVTLVVTATAASISGLLPTSGPVGTTVTITGSSFGASQGSSIVTFNGTSAATVYSWSASSIEVAVPSGATTGNLVVTVGGVASNGMPFTVGPLGFVTYVYDDLGRLVSVVDQTGAGANYKYDAVGNLLSITRETPVAISSITPTSQWAHR
jgi:YD repeat-containing protein